MEKITFTDFYDNKVYTEELPNCTPTEFLRQRNKNYMDYIAISSEDGRKITYEQMHEEIERYTKYLYYVEGIRREDRVGISMLNCPESIYILYALYEIGCEVIGLNPFNNNLRMNKDIMDTKPTRVIVINGMQNNLVNINVSPIIYPVDEKKIKRVEDKPDIEKYYEPDRVTDVIFTGGTTGNHKGTELVGNGINCVAQALDHVFVAKPGMTQLGNIPFSNMCFGRITLHYALANNLNFASTTKFMPQDFVPEIIRTHSDAVTGGPVHWNTLHNNPLIKPGVFSNLIQATSGGEYFKPAEEALANEALKNGGSKTTIGSVLGMTEFWAPVMVCMGGKNTKGTIGYPIPYTKVKVVDENFREVKDGECGSLLLSGPAMMKGYRNRPNDTLNAFWTDENNVKWYITGDNVKKSLDNPNEYIYIGRSKRNFVCGIDNIYPEQIENLLLEIDENIKEVAVTKIPDAKYQYLPIYHICVDSMNFDQKDLENKINTMIVNHIGSSALPAKIFYTLEYLPRTSNAKIDYALLEKNDNETLKEKPLTLKRNF